MFWNHPSVVGVTYWGYVVCQTWRNGTGLMQSNGTARPALTWMLNYVKQNPKPALNFPNLLNKNGVSISRPISAAKGFRAGAPAPGMRRRK